MPSNPRPTRLPHSRPPLALCRGFAALLVVAAAGVARAGDAALIEQGRYLATAGDCVACHTRPGGEPFAGGVPLTTPFGLIYTANITPDKAAGIGTWSESQFARAMREGVAADGSHLYPAFPYTAYTRLSDGDTHAIYAYLQSLPPASYAPPPSQLRFPFSVRRALAAWKLLYFAPGRFVADPVRPAEWNRGAYLTQGLGHCGGCHTPRTALGGERTSEALTGGVLLEEIADEVIDTRLTPLDERTIRLWSAPNLTPASNGLGAWSLADIVDYLRSGHSVRAAGFGPMGRVIASSTSHLRDEDLHAIAVYLKSLPATAVGEPARVARERLRAGEIVYTARCGDCHLQSGAGVSRARDASKAAPPLAGSAALQAPNPATLINVVLYGAHEIGESAGGWPRMSGFELSVGLDDEQIAAVCTYVRSSWGNHAGAVDAAAVAAQR